MAEAPGSVWPGQACKQPVPREGDPDFSLASFIGAAKPDLKPTQLAVVEEKLGKARALA